MQDLREEFRAFTEKHLPQELPHFEVLWEVTQEWLAEWDGVLPEHWPVPRRPEGDVLAELGFADLAGLDAVLPSLRRAAEATCRQLWVLQQEGKNQAADPEWLAMNFADRFGVPRAYAAGVPILASKVVEAHKQLGLAARFQVIWQGDQPAHPEEVTLDHLDQLEAHGLKPEQFDFWLNIPALDFRYRVKAGGGYVHKSPRLNQQQMKLLTCLLRDQNRTCPYRTLTEEVWPGYDTQVGIEPPRDPYYNIHTGISRLREAIKDKRISILKSRITPQRGDGYMLVGSFSYCSIRLRLLQTSYKPA